MRHFSSFFSYYLCQWPSLVSPPRMCYRTHFVRYVYNCTSLYFPHVSRCESFYRVKSLSFSLTCSTRHQNLCLSSNISRNQQSWKSINNKFWWNVKQNTLTEMSRNSWNVTDKHTHLSVRPACVCTADIITRISESVPSWLTCQS